MKTETMMKFKSMFEEQKRNLVYTRGVLDEGLQLPQEELADEADICSSELETSMRIRLRNREALFIKKIDEALGRIAAGTFGCCEKCEEDIEERRLEARPTATLCATCKEESERMESLHIDGHKHKSLGRRVMFRAV